VPGSLSFVPKDAKIHRSIVVEPALNSMVQRGIGRLLKEKLRSQGVDLYDQTRNQRLARVGSLDGSLATIDLSSASDTLSRELVYELLPLDWAIFLNYSRTSEVKYKGNLIQLEKWSSMGNGYTFELESMIFYALAFGVCRDLGLPTQSISVYGDDIIVPVEAYTRLRRVLEFCGFTVNNQKSFYSGPFRESCGKDYLSGIDVRPIYVKDLLTYRDLYRLHNFFYSQYDDESCELVLKYIPLHLRLYGPDDERYGHGHLWSREFCKKPYKRARGWGGFVFDTYTLKPTRCFRPLPGDYILPVYSIYAFGSAEDVDHFVVRGDRGYKRTSIYSLTP
jgi:hypothetical protein